MKSFLGDGSCRQRRIFAGKPVAPPGFEISVACFECCAYRSRIPVDFEVCVKQEKAPPWLLWLSKSGVGVLFCACRFRAGRSAILRLGCLASHLGKLKSSRPLWEVFDLGTLLGGSYCNNRANLPNGSISWIKWQLFSSALHSHNREYENS